MQTNLVSVGNNLLRTGAAMLSSAWGKRAIVIVASLFVVYQLAQIFWLLLPADQAPANIALPTVQLDSQQRSSKTATPDAQSIAKAQWFGSAEQKSEVAKPRINPALSAAETQAVESRLNLKLYGVMLSDNPESSRAMIEYQSKQELYKIGQTLSVGRQVTLVKVLADRVILENAGRYEYLGLYDKKADKDLGRAVAVRAVAAQSVAEDVDLRDRADISAAMAGYREKLLSNPQSLAEVVRVTPVNENGSMQGFRVAPGSDAKQFAAVGLKSGDIITAVNGIVFDDPSAVMGLLGPLSDASELALSVERNGEPMTIYLSLDAAE